FLANRKGAMPPEFLIRSAGELEPWTVQDSLGWLKMMSYDLGGATGARELDRFAISQIVSHEAMMEFWPPYPGAEPLDVPDIPEFYGLEPNLGELPRQASSLLPSDELNAMHPAGALFPGIGSNNWVISGEHTKSGLPIVANDPHLGLTTPQVWYYAHLVSEEGLDVMGVTFPGVPYVVLGRTQRVAWGFTNTAPDVQDYYIEKIAPGESRSYVTPTGTEPFKTRVEEIAVKGGETVRIKVRETRHGPVMSDVLGSVGRYLGDEFVLAVRWTALDPDDTTADAASALNRVQSAEEFFEATRNFVSPQQNMVFADVDGNIGYIAPGRVPMRGEGNLTRGFVPAPGWDAAYDWTGYIPFEELPRHYNPESGMVVTANENIVETTMGPDYPHYITSEWSDPYRGDRIRALLAETDKHDLETLAAVQTDTKSTFAEEFTPRLIDATDASQVNARILADLDLWNGFDASVDSWEMALFMVWIREVNNLLFRDEWDQLNLGPKDDASRNTWKTKPELLKAMLDGRSTRWCGDAVADPAPKGVEACRDIVTRAFNNAVERLEQRLGKDHKSWRWGEIHIATMSHTFESVGGPIRAFFQNEIGAPGGPFTVNVGGGSQSDNGEMMSMGAGPSLRHLFDMSDLDNSLFMTSNGQSGNPISGLHKTFLEPWAAGDYFRFSGRKRDAEISRVGKLKLQPE
ncbi:MAG: penicillin acylase family protein, partial [Alphaproteobacteria bacterium]